MLERFCDSSVTAATNSQCGRRLINNAMATIEAADDNICINNKPSFEAQARARREKKRGKYLQWNIALSTGIDISQEQIGTRQPMASDDVDNIAHATRRAFSDVMALKAEAAGRSNATSNRYLIIEAAQKASINAI